MIGKGTKLYVAGGDTLSYAFNKAMDNYEKGKTWPTINPRKTFSPAICEGLDDTLKGLGIDLD